MIRINRHTPAACALALAATLVITLAAGAFQTQTAQAADAPAITVVEQEQEHHRRVAEANRVFNCLQTHAALRSEAKSHITSGYTTSGLDAEFSDLKAEYVLEHRYLFIEFNVPFNWRELGDPLMQSLDQRCQQAVQQQPF